MTPPGQAHPVRVARREYRPSGAPSRRVCGWVPCAPRPQERSSAGLRMLRSPREPAEERHEGAPALDHLLLDLSILSANEDEVLVFL